MDSTTVSSLSGHGNPWSSQDKSLHPLRQALKLAEQTGHIAKRTEYDEEPIDEESRARLPSLKLIQVLKAMSQAKNDLNRVNLEIQNRMQDKETNDITHLDVLEERISKIKSLNSHIESIIESKPQLIQRLQQPFQGEFLKLEAQYHKFACELFPQIAPLLSELTTNLENIVWAKSLSLKDGRVDAMITEMCSVLSAMQSSFQSYHQIHQSMGQLHGLQTGALHSTHIESVESAEL